ncbi:hypothetical protein ACW4FQ_32405, partial [Escherichia coli]
MRCCSADSVEDTVSSALRPGQGGSRSGGIENETHSIETERMRISLRRARNGRGGRHGPAGNGAADTAKPVQGTAMCPAPPYRRPSACSD